MPKARNAACGRWCGILATGKGAAKSAAFVTRARRKTAWRSSSANRRRWSKPRRNGPLKLLLVDGSKSTGKLHSELFPRDDLKRREFEELLGALARAGLAEFEDRVFEKDGKLIPYRLVSLTSAGEAAAQANDIEFLMKEEIGEGAKRRRAKKRKAAAKRAPKRLTEDDVRIEKALRAWRLAEAKKRGVPAFRILTDQVLHTMAEDRPATDDDLLSISGVGLATVKKYGAEIIRIVSAGCEEVYGFFKALQGIARGDKFMPDVSAVADFVNGLGKRVIDFLAIIQFVPARTAGSVQMADDIAICFPSRVMISPCITCT